VLIIRQFGCIICTGCTFLAVLRKLALFESAFAGAEQCPKVSLNYRNQWPALGPTYVTYSASYDQYLNALQGGVGLHLMNDVQGGGVITTTMISGMYSYTLPVTRRFFVAGGFQVSYIMKTINGILSSQI
jgi:hypothetical protein